MTRCLVCGSEALDPWAVAEDIEYRSVPDPYAFARCTACGNLSISPVPSDRLAEIYPSTYYAFDEQSKGLVQAVKRRLDQRSLRRLTAQIPGDDLAALDIGGGSGFVLDQLLRATPRVRRCTIVDIDPGAQSLAESRGYDFFLGRVEDYPEREAFDVVLMLNLIEHVSDPAGVLRKVAKLARPGGRILIKTPNFDSLDQRLFRHRSWGGFHCPRHWVLFTMPSFAKLARACGLEVVECRYTQGAPFWSVSALDWLQRKRLIRRQTQPLFRHALYGPLNAVFAAFDFARMPFSKTSQMVFVLKPAADA